MSADWFELEMLRIERALIARKDREFAILVAKEQERLELKAAQDLMDAEREAAYALETPEQRYERILTWHQRGLLTPASRR